MRKQKQILFSFLGLLALFAAMPCFVSAQETETLMEEGESMPVAALGEEVPALAPDMPSSAELDAEGDAPLMAETETASSDQAQPTLMIHLEQLAWNEFRFRPSFELGSGGQIYAWDFGDGSASEQRIVEHTFSKPGQYQVSLRIEKSDGSSVEAALPVQIGFFHLANWRLWVLIVLLAAIIIVAAVIAGVTDHVVKSEAKPRVPLQPQPSRSGEGEEETLMNALSDASGDLDSLAATGLDADALAQELSLLEPIGSVPEKAPKATEPVQVKPASTLIPLKESQPEALQPAQSNLKPPKKERKRKTRTASAKGRKKMS
jgi:hypothetical protein